MATILDISQEYLDRLASIEAQAMQSIIAAYASIVTGLESDLAAVVRDIAARQAAGEIVTSSMVRRVERLEQLLQQAQAELAGMVAMTDLAVTSAQQQATALAQSAAEELLRSSLGTIPQGVTVVFNRLPVEAIRILVGSLQDGSPLFDAFHHLGNEAIQAIRQEIVSGMASGLGPRTVARRIKRIVGANMEDALTIARTAIINAYREANRQTFLANADVLMGWVWTAKLDARTCPFCWAQHGTLHELTETMATHARCRCTPVPRAKSWADLGFPMIGEADAGPRLPLAADD